jgi:hypothetical protein
MRLALLSLAVAVALAAAAPEPAGEAPLDQGYREMYNLRFDEAQRIFAGYQRANPKDPMGPVSEAAAWLFAEFDRLKILQSEFWANDQSFVRVNKLAADPGVRSRFEQALGKTHDLADARLRESPDDGNAMLAGTLRLGLHADYLALIEKRNMPALTEMKESRALAEKLLASHPDYYDANIASGVENYLLSLRAAPLRWILQATGAQTDRAAGLARLRLTAEKGHYLMPYARLLLAVADLRAGDRASARARLEWLAKEYPANKLYREELSRLN